MPAPPRAQAPQAPPADKKPHTALQKIKILVSFAQMLTSFKGAFNLEYPAEVTGAINQIKVLAVDVMAYVKTGCLWHPDYLMNVV